jgi:DNA invertase Pin-like site-specific DNA recombinase
MRQLATERRVGMGRTIGYARVSTEEQDVGLQLDALHQAGCPDGQIFLDVASGTSTTRPGLAACLRALAPGDTLIVWRLDRLGRSMLHLVTVIAELGQRQVGFRSLCDGALDTTPATGELVFHIFSALAQFERRLIQERTRAGLAAARARGKHGGRRPLRADAPQVRMAQVLSTDRRVTVSEICRSLRISRATFYRYVALARQVPEEPAHEE